MSTELFVALVREYKALVDSAPQRTAHSFLLACARVLCRLYAAGLDLPHVEPTENDIVESAESPDKRISALLGMYDYYLEVFDPYQNEQPVGGLISDDLADIYLDLVNPLRAYDEGRHLDAVWQWRFNLGTHCGNHMVDTMRAIHRLVHDHMPDDYVADDHAPDDFVNQQGGPG